MQEILIQSMKMLHREETGGRQADAKLTRVRSVKGLTSPVSSVQRSQLQSRENTLFCWIFNDYRLQESVTCPGTSCVLVKALTVLSR